MKPRKYLNPPYRLTSAFLLYAGLTLLAGYAQATPLVWSNSSEGPDGRALWSTTVLGWDSGTSAFVNGSEVLFNGGGSGNVGVQGDLNVGNMSFSGKDYSIGTASSSVSSLTLNTGLIDVASGVTATFSNPSFSLAGTNGITKTGGGTLYLNVPSSISGAIQVTGGTLQLQDADWVTGSFFDSAGMTGPITVGSGATLSLSSGVTQIKNGLTLNGGTVRSRGNLYGTGNGSWGNILLSSNITAGGSAASSITSEIRLYANPVFDVGSGSSLNVSGGIAISPLGGSFGFSKSGAGTLTLSGSNSSVSSITLNGVTTVFAGGQTTIAGNLTLNVEGGNGLFFTGGTVTMNQLKFEVT